ncbi:hypothetical protein [Wolbachia endosymbiont (group B) of Gerris lacustris]|uniref:hypothetical protein n=1 Tax=Wolbachia endosymbiont (group B) of Gerris lacustris TaxID=3066159 RepID=UPI0033425653
MSREMVNALKSQVKELKHANLVAKGLSSQGWYEIYSGKGTYIDLHRCGDITINGQKVTSEFIGELYSKHESLVIIGDNYHPFLKAVFTEMFEHVGAAVPNDYIMEELINNYYQGGYIFFVVSIPNKILNSLESYAKNKIIKHNMDCHEPNCLKLSFSVKYTNIVDMDSYGGIMCIKEHDLCNSVEFNLKYKGENVTYEDGKILLKIPKELENYKAGNDSLLDKLTDIINKLVEYFKKLCEKLGFKFDTKIEYNSERNINIEHNLGKPLKVIDEPDIYAVNGLELRGR